MPLPKPKKGEDKQDFVSRCIADVTKTEKDKWPSAKQRAAVCYSQSGESRAQQQNAHEKSVRKEKQEKSK